jgi:hypothetical protein
MPRRTRVLTLTVTAAAAMAVASTLAGAQTSTKTVAPMTSVTATRSLGKPLTLRFGVGAALPVGATAILRITAVGRSGSVVITSTKTGPSLKRRLIVGRLTSINVTALLRPGGTRFVRIRTLARGLKVAGAKRQPVLRITRPVGDPPPPPPPPADTSPPTAPGALSATATRNALTITWPAASDDRGVTGYRLTLNGGPALSLTTASYVATALDCQAPYAIDVRAVDAAGNVGAPSGQTFTTSACPTIAAAGDIACDSGDPNFNGGAGTAAACRQRYVAQSIIQANPEAFLMLGDAQYAQWGPGTTGTYATEFAPLASRTWAIQGNHDFDSGGGALSTGLTAGGFFGYFGARAGPVAYQSYSFDIGTWHLVVLNSNCTVLVVNCPAQTAWLQNDLAQTRQPCIAAAWHHPRWVSPGGSEVAAGTYADNPASAPWMAALYAKGADVVMSGHSHHYERSFPVDPNKVRDDAKGLRIFVAGSGGKEFRPASPLAGNPTDPASINNATFGFLKLTLKARSFDHAFVRESGPSFSDSGTVACHAKS